MASSAAEAVAIAISVVSVAVSVAVSAMVVSEFVLVVGVRSAVMSDDYRDKTFSMW